MTSTTTPTRRSRKLLILAAVAVAVLLFGGMTLRRFVAAHADPENLPELLAVGSPAPAFTADWCLTCKVNERVAFGSGAVRAAIREHGVTLLRADWTTRDPAVTRALAAFGRNSVPFVVIYPRAREAAPIILPTLLTSGIVTGALQRAAASPSAARTSAASTSGRIQPSLAPKATQ